MVDGLVVPENIPGTDIDPPGIEGAANKITAVATALNSQTGIVLQAWRGLSASYVAPESATLLGALDTIEPAVESIGDVFDKLSSILVTFAEKAAPIRTSLIDLKGQAVTFVAEARAGYTVEWWHPDHPASDHGFFGFMTTDFVDMGPKWIPWNKYTEAVDRNYELYSQINEQVALLDQARVEAVNAINALNTLMCVAPEVAIDAETLNLEGVELPWGSATRGDRTEYESVEDGANQALIALLDGIGALMAIDAQEEAPEDALFQWELAGQAWAGLAQGVGSILYSPVALATQAWGDDWPQWMQDAEEWDSEMLVGMYEGFVGTPEEWERDPYYAGGKLGFNVVSMLLGGGVSAALKGGSLAARLATFVDGFVPGGRFLVQAVDGLGHDLAASTRGLAASLVEKWGPRLVDDTGSLGWLDEVIRGTDDNVPDYRPDADVPTTHHGGADGEPAAPHHGDGPALEGPVRDDPPGGPKDPDAQNDPNDPNAPNDPDAPTSTPISDSIETKTDPVHSGSSGVDGEWARTGDKDVTPKDLHYGEPMSGHGTSTFPENPGAGGTGFDLVTDPGAPYGRFPDGTPLTQVEYDARYTRGGTNYDNYPPNDGAVRGTRVEYVDPAAFIRDYGDLLDRVGKPSGFYLGLRPDGIPATWEQRALPVSSLGERLVAYTFSGSLPEGWKIEISEIRSGFGQPGGGLQVLIRDAAGVAKDVQALVDLGVMK